MPDRPAPKTDTAPAVEPVVHVYRLYLVTGEKPMVNTTVDLLHQVQLEGSWVDAGQSGYINPAHIVRIEVVR